MPDRPRRTRLADELGRTRTLATGPESFEDQGHGRPLFLGLGPEPGMLPAWFPEAAAGADYVECPEFEAALGPEWAASVPSSFRRLDPADLAGGPPPGARLVTYRQNARLFPAFWGPLLAALALPPGPAPATRSVWLPGSETSLLLRELEAAFAGLGFAARRVPEDPRALPGLLREERPALYLSVNFRGLDPHGGAFHLLRRAGAEVAAWCVDNPFHLLTALRSRFWTETLLLVTDASFLGPLADCGAGRMGHLPLAASPGFEAQGPLPRHAGGLEERLVFVGRSSFPDQEAFFAGAGVPPEAREEALELLERAQRPDFGWWVRRLGLHTLWPGNAVRGAGLGADETGRAWRTQCLRAAGDRLTVFGDSGWQNLLPPGADLRPPVDYYGGLSAVYRQAACALNVTGMLLPAGLTQRHFDVWTAGGFLLTDRTPALEIFPRELWEPVSFSAAEEIPGLFARFGQDGPGRRELARAWREHLLAGHTYRHRAEAVLRMTGLDRGAL